MKTYTWQTAKGAKVEMELGKHNFVKRLIINGTEYDGNISALPGTSTPAVQFKSGGKIGYVPLPAEYVADRQKKNEELQKYYSDLEKIEKMMNL